MIKNLKLHRALLSLGSLARCFILLYLILTCGNWIADQLPIQLPGSILGMTILFSLLIFQIIPVHWMRFGCQLIIRYMALFFIPATMGIMDTYLALLNDWLPILGGTLFSTLVVFILIALLTDKWTSEHETQQEERELQ